MAEISLGRRESLEEIVIRHPYTTGYFTEKDLPDAEWRATVEDFLRENQLSLSELEEDLRRHLKRVQVPDSECDHAVCLPFSWLCLQDFQPAIDGLIGRGLLRWDRAADWIRSKLE